MVETVNVIVSKDIVVLRAMLPPVVHEDGSYLHAARAEANCEPVFRSPVRGRAVFQRRHTVFQNA
jgi:hypothetical protein